ncbi:Transposase IS116/IS110/IS902 family [Alistipes sp. cv1]|uniref:IS110 family transposase n=1 Tax=Alistipes indistinctus TaxID=626932 RepID=UPI0006C20105|nr:Transposase IS116/IS110/IS902 family [Faecalibacterium prausnitzii]
MRGQVNKLDFNGQNIYVGIDVHLKSWSVTVLSESSVLKKFRQDPRPEALHKFLVTNYPGASYYSVYEAGFSGFWTHNRLSELGINNIVVNPADVPTMLKEKLRKTDAVDCGKLARGLRAGDLQGIYIPRAEILEIRSLIRLRNSIVKDTTREKNRIKSLLRFHGIEIPDQFTRHSIGNWSKRFLQWLGEVDMSTEYGRKTLDLHIEQFVRLRQMLLQETRVIRQLSRSEPFAEPLRLLMTVPGIGITTGITLLTEIDNASRFKSAEQLAAYIGLIPMCHSSGEKEGIGDITVRKHAILRCYLVEAAWIAIRKDPAMTMAYEEYKKRMNGNKAIVKIARKLVNRIFFVLKRKTEYVPGVVE